MKKIIVFIISFICILNIANAQWQHTNDNEYIVWELAVSNDTIIANTIDYGVYLTSDNGNTWTQIKNGV